MASYDWPQRFKQLHEKAVVLYREGRRDARGYFDASERKFLRAIGCSPQEVYDFAEDWCSSEAPDFATALLITAARRDYFLTIQQAMPSGKIEPEDTLPAREAKLGGIAWLPRIIEKAKRKLQGTLPDDVMYCCGGDRHFLKKHHIHPADFLRVVWSAREDDARILDYVRRQMAG